MGLGGFRTTGLDPRGAAKRMGFPLLTVLLGSTCQSFAAVTPMAFPRYQRTPRDVPWLLWITAIPQPTLLACVLTSQGRLNSWWSVMFALPWLQMAAACVWLGLLDAKQQNADPSRWRILSCVSAQLLIGVFVLGYVSAVGCNMGTMTARKLQQKRVQDASPHQSGVSPDKS